VNRIDEAFARRRDGGGAAMIFYLTAGYPDLAATESAIDALAEAGTDILELGIPFSDPIADGPTIQKASQVALQGGITVRGVLELAGRVRQRHPKLAILLFGAYNPIFRFGDGQFVAEAVHVGADGLLVPDLPPESAGELRRHAGDAGLSTVFLVAPTTQPRRAALIAEASEGFIYYISLKGVTGARDQLPPDLEKHVRALKGQTAKPVAVGFGVSAPEQGRAIAAFADGVVVGSALVKLMGARADASDFARHVLDYARPMVEAVGAARSPAA
jgi:tryptophan synthase alpha chain